MIKTRQIDPTNFQVERLDFFIASSGYESRANFQSEKFHSISQKKYVLGFDVEKVDPTRKKNDQFFENAGFIYYEVSGENLISDLLNHILLDIETFISSDGLTHVYIDYSCMSRNWYSYLLYGFTLLQNNHRFRFYFGYSHAKYVCNDGNDTLNRIVKPLLGFCDLSVPSKPTALIVGMGNEANRVLGLKEYFDAVPYLFYSDPSYNEKYGEEVEEVNGSIIAETKSENVFKYPVNDLIYTEYILNNLCRTLENNYRIIIAPCGPKPFALLAMITSLKLDFPVEVWRISPGSKVSKIDRVPTGLISLLEVKFG